MPAYSAFVIIFSLTNQPNDHVIPLSFPKICNGSSLSRCRHWMKLSVAQDCLQYLLVELLTSVETGERTLYTFSIANPVRLNGLPSPRTCGNFFGHKLCPVDGLMTRRCARKPSRHLSFPLHFPLSSLPHFYFPREN